MDRIDNPFTPGAGSPPPELVGRDDLLEEARVLMGRIANKKAEKSMLLTGLRGVGKTVLLNEMRRIAEQGGYRALSVEAHENKALSASLVPLLRQLLYDLDRIAGASHKVRRALSVMRSFLSAFKATVGDVEFSIDPETGTADSGDLEIDLPDLFEVIAEAAEDRGTLVVLLIDELQYYSEKELSALIMGMHRMQQRQLPLVLLGAGLPILPRLAGESKSYAERLFHFPNIGPLPEADAFRALRDPVRAAGVDFEDAALREIYQLTQGYPYFIQEWGYRAWNHATVSPITSEDVLVVTPQVIESLDANFFRVRFDRLTPGEKNFIRAMAELGAGPYRSADIAATLGVQVTSLGPARANLIKKGMIYSPSHGDITFTVPLFDSFVRRAMSEFVRKAGRQEGR